MDAEIVKLTPGELKAKHDELLADRDGLQSQIVELMHRQATIDNELAIVGMLIEKAKRG